jgi:hypothetical protein
MRFSQANSLDEFTPETRVLDNSVPSIFAGEVEIGQAQCLLRPPFICSSAPYAHTLIHLLNLHVPEAASNLYKEEDRYSTFVSIIDTSNLEPGQECSIRYFNEMSSM